MKSVVSAIVVVAALAASSAASAASPSYSFVQLGYARFNSSGTAFNGISFTGDAAFTDSIYGTLAYQQASILGTTDTAYGFGLGFHAPLSAATDIVIAANHQHSQFAGLSTGSSSGVELGLRGMVNEKVELNAALDWAHSSASTSTGYGVGGVFYFTDRVGLVISHSLYNHPSFDQTVVGFRATF